MNMIFSLIWFIIIFSIVVTSHEFGHFIVAKANGIRRTALIIVGKVIAGCGYENSYVYGVCNTPASGPRKAG